MYLPGFSPLHKVGPEVGRGYAAVHDREELLQARRRISLVVIHCSGTRYCDRYTPEQLRADHLRRGFSDAGYHYYITREGVLYEMRPVDQVGAHVRGYNQFSIGVCYEGGLDKYYQPRDTRTSAQRQMLEQLVRRLQAMYPEVIVVGHRDLSPDRNGDGVVTREEWVKQCPCFDARVYNQKPIYH